MSKYARIATAIFCLVCAVAFIFLANYLAGVVLFLSYKQNPSGATFDTLRLAWEAASTDYAVKKVKASAGLALIVCGIAFAILMQMFFSGSRKQHIHGNARFANHKDIASEKLDSPKGIILGRLGKVMLRLPGYEFVLVAAATRTGKGIGFCIPNLLTFPDSAVVIDIKEENYNLTSAYRRKYLKNEVYYFNPFSEHTARWNPLSYISSDPNFRVNDLMALAQIIYPSNPKDPFWPDSARGLFVGLGLLVLETPSLPHTIGEILRQGSGKGQQISDYLTHVLNVRSACDVKLSATCIDFLTRFLNNPDNTLKNIVSSFVAPLSMWGNAVVDKATSADDFDLRDVRRKRMTIYTCIPPNEVLQAGFILNVFYSQLINENTRTLPEHDPSLKYQCLQLMDEFTAIGKLAIVAKAVGYMAGYNMRLALVIQDRSQLEAVYGKEDAHNIISNMGAMIVFTPNQVREAEEYSKLIGNQTINSSSKQRSNIGAFTPGRSSVSETESPHARPIMLPQEILSMDKKSELVVRAGIPIIKARKIHYFSDPYFLEKFNAVPMHRISINGEFRNTPIPLPKPPTNWRIFKQEMNWSNYYLQDDFSDLSPAFGDYDDEELLESLNTSARTMTDDHLDAMCAALSQRKVDEYEALFLQSAKVV